MIAEYEDKAEAMEPGDCVLRFHPGDIFRFKGLRLQDNSNGKERWSCRPGFVKLVGVAKHVRTLQTLVVYEGMDNGRREKLFVCTLADWVRNFDPPPAEVEAVEPVAPVPGKVAGTKEKGMGA